MARLKYIGFDHVLFLLSCCPQRSTTCGRWFTAGAGWWFAVGLVHGFGFASVLADLGLPQGALLIALVGFNLGVEAGQLAIVGAFLPLAYALRSTWFYRKVVFAGGSAAIVLVAGVWLAERALDLKLLGA